MDKQAIRHNRIEQRFKDTYDFAMRARNFTPQELIKQASDLIVFARKLNRIDEKSGVSNDG